MKSPLELAGPRVLLTANDDHLWERTEEHEGSRGLHEGAQILKRDGLRDHAGDGGADAAGSAD